jgi:hypothetical protein
VPDVALAQHLLPGIAGTVRTRSGPFMSAADSLKVTVYGRGGHGSTPQSTVDPVVRAECQASGAPRDPEFETTLTFPVTSNDPAVTSRVAQAFAAH